MRNYRFVSVLIGLTAIGSVSVGHAGDLLDLSIYDVQFTTDPAGNSPYNGQIHNVTGGIVTHVWSGFNDRVYLRDPAHPSWGAIVVKDGEGGELANNVSVGDWVSFENIFIDEYRGTTFLQYRRQFAPNVAFTVETTGNPVPPPTLLTAADLAAPIEGPPGQWYVADHSSEPHESMTVTLENVTVGQMDLGKADDNYELLQGGDTAWGTDYMNIDAGGPYHPYITTGANLLSITGIVEQYTKLVDGWDYYQLNTRFGSDIVVPEPAGLSLLVAALVLARRRLR